jgi:hypothetical protein
MKNFLVESSKFAVGLVIGLVLAFGLNSCDVEVNVPEAVVTEASNVEVTIAGEKIDTSGEAVIIVLDKAAGDATTLKENVKEK